MIRYIRIEDKAIFVVAPSSTKSRRKITAKRSFREQSSLVQKHFSPLHEIKTLELDRPLIKTKLVMRYHWLETIVIVHYNWLKTGSGPIIENQR